jgi:P27 family predicted phage terminase small subunit
MRPGPPPKPPELKLLHGNKGHRPINTPKVLPLPGAECPDFLSAEAKREWARLYPELMRLGLLKQIDRAALSALCEAWANYKAATEMIGKEGIVAMGGNGTMVQHPAVIVQKGMMEKIQRLAAEFGMTPSARGRVHIGGAGEDQESDEEKFFRPRSIEPPPPRRPSRARKPRD